MKIAELFEGYGQDNKEYQAWIKACRKVAPDCQFSGSEYQAQAVDWTTKNNEVVGDWDGKKGVVYEPGSKGKRVIEAVAPEFEKFKKGQRVKIKKSNLAEAKKSQVDDSPLGQLKRLPQPIGINGGSYTYWVDVTKTPLKFTASDGSEVDEAKTLEDIAEWMDKWAAKIWLEFLNDEEGIDALRDENILRVKKGRTNQQDHEENM